MAVDDPPVIRVYVGMLVGLLALVFSIYFQLTWSYVASTSVLWAIHIYLLAPVIGAANDPSELP